MIRKCLCVILTAVILLTTMSVGLGCVTASAGGTYTMNVGDSKTLHLITGESISNARWTTNNIAVSVTGLGSMARVEVLSYSPMTTIIQCTYHYWKTDVLSGSRRYMTGFDDFYIDINKPTLTLTLSSSGPNYYNSTKSIKYGESIGTLPTLTADGYTFVEWNTSSYGTGKTVTSSSSFTENTTIYAQWRRDSSSSPTVKPTEKPTEKPTVKPIVRPTEIPTERPTVLPDLHQYQTSSEAIADYEASHGVTVDTYRYYFQMPDGVHGMRDSDGSLAPSWYNKYTDSAGVYWWGSAEVVPEVYPGFKATAEDKDQSIYYADVPRRTTAFEWTNLVDGGMDSSQDIFYNVAMTVMIPCEYPDPGEYRTIPEGASSFDGCIFIIDPEKVSVNAMSKKITCGGNWYFYYGGGCYGMYAADSSHFSSIEENCCNPDHRDADDRHIIPSPTELNTQPPTQAPTDPPTDPPAAPATQKPTQFGTQTPTEDLSGNILGDVDGDGNVTIFDASLIQKHIAGSSSAVFAKAVADVDRDDNVTIFDASLIQKHIAGSASTYGIGEPIR